jgi:hypothetical protein
MRVFLLSRAALPASSSTSAHRYSITAARYTAAPPLRNKPCHLTGVEYKSTLGERRKRCGTYAMRH